MHNVESAHLHYQGEPRAGFREILCNLLFYLVIKSVLQILPRFPKKVVS